MPSLSSSVSGVLAAACPLLVYFALADAQTPTATDPSLTNVHPPGSAPSPASAHAPASAPSPASSHAPASSRRDGQHDFDFEIGTWRTHLKRLMHPLSGSTTWVEYDGTTVVRKIWSGRSNLVELEVDGPNGHIEGASWRLYNPESHQWSLNFANSAAGALSTPTIGEFANGRGEFYDQETLGARSILVRFVISEMTATSVHFEQAYSDDGGKSWELNWIADDSRMPDAAE